MTEADIYTILPLIILVSWACVLLLVDLFIPKKRKSITALLGAFGLALTLGISLTQIDHDLSGFNGMVVLDGFAHFVIVLILVTGLLGIGLAHSYIKRLGLERGEYYGLLLFCTAGMMLMAQATDLIVIFLALELLSIPLYVLAAFARPKAESEEAGLKYFLLGAFASGFVVYGIALVFGAAGSTSLIEIGRTEANLPLLLIGAALMLVGFSFKVAAVPFHMWTPDVYEGAPSSVTGFMAAGAKIAGFAALMRVFLTAFSNLDMDMTPVIWTLSALTMIAGNLIAIAQTNIKRMLAYSSIAHTGYILMAFVAYGDPAVAPVSVAAGLFYLAAYTVTNFGTWGIVIAMEKAEGSGLEIAGYAGLGRKSPGLAAAMTIFMLSLTGIPPTLGLIGKFYLFRAVIQGGFYWLAIIGVLTSLISAFYYLRVIIMMYMREGEPQTSKEYWLSFTVAITALITVLMSFLPGPLFKLASEAVLRLF